MNPRKNKKVHVCFGGEEGKGKIMSSYYNFKNDYKRTQCNFNSNKGDNNYQ